MSKVRQQTAKLPPMTMEQCKNIFNNIFLHNEDSWHEIQDQVLLNIINDEKRIPDAMKIELLFRKYRDTARDLNLYSK